MLPLSPKTKQLLEKIFSGPKIKSAAEMLEAQCGNNLPFYEKSASQSIERIRFAALKLSGGDLEKLREAVQLAQTDWRDVLVAAGFLLALTRPSAQTPAPQRTAPTFRSASEAIVVDVVVRDRKGRPITDLTAIDESTGRVVVTKIPSRRQQEAGAVLAG